jgi:hypothetical protein
MNTIANPESSVTRAPSVSQAIVLLKALEAICELDAGSNLVSDRHSVCDAMDVARSLIRRAKENTDQTGAWNTSEAPRDRAIVAVGKVMVSDEWSTAAIPFCTAIEWREISGHSDWYHYYGEPLTVRRALDEEIIIHYWQELPQERLGPGRPA